MAVPVVSVNVLAVLVAGVAAFIVGMTWFSPMLFGKQWMRLSGITEKQMQAMKKKDMTKSMVGGLITAIVMAFILAHVLAYMQAGTLMEGLMGGFWMWLGFIATIEAGMVLWQNKPVKLYLLIVAHDLVAVFVMSAILTLWV